MEGREIRVRGQVQGVGFRPFVWLLAEDLGIRGEVLNDTEGVLIRAIGGDLNRFQAALRENPPPLARVDSVESWPIRFSALPRDFTIAPSEGKGAETRVTPDAATCPACLEETRTQGRRQGYAFTNCTHCGPRFSILTGLPYDRAQTTMAGFDMCPACRAEYANPADRRFHAQPIACPACGPRLWMEPAAKDPIAAAARLLAGGKVLAIKGLGGFHLACDARDATAVDLLRRRKHRPAKPFALMATEAILPGFCAPDMAEIALMRDPAAPVVLVRATGTLPDTVAPGMTRLGVMLPYTPLHHLLLEAFGGPLVMTSGNLSGEPQVIANDEARKKLGPFVDSFLMHDRPIARRLDDGVECASPPMVLRRARGRVPGTLPLPEGFADAPQVLALGGQMKGAICLTKNGQALLSHHLGTLDDALCWEAFRQAQEDYAALFDHRPEIVACDTHPGYRTTGLAPSLGLPVEHIQHHHAHLAACLAEALWPLDGGPVAGIILDGTGLGSDGTFWGGEVLLGDYRSARRVAHLAPAPLAGGDMAARQPWRNLLVRLDQAGLGDLADRLLADCPRDALRAATRAGVNAPQSSSAGRLFDAFAAGLGLCPLAQTYEGEAAMRLEALAEGHDAPAYPMGRADGVIDPAPLFAAWAGERTTRPPGEMAARFHAGLAGAFAQEARSLVERGQARAVALSGGCFQNARLLAATLKALEGVPVLVHRQVPSNDGGLALGQAVAAAARHLENSETP
ncbi:hydrogenase maturation carbamoyltransferase HypF [Rhodovulum imhoffii]|uniref:Carbamoyltransferase HypF n=1 Tax=Rhodovulum imhoffii TaxID=365340 RepID=A0A2T5BSD7_9RHOB|nr:carbamoyltransferase HypF [Rhodovulum imhoffii]MBK5934737.1 carbamoyltransferase HypF [Rhodovulum imhoffii]PTN02161.1 hydrogenase maturation carbamoyltransferase HypF [Rhodovulum imhoffii]